MQRLAVFVVLILIVQSSCHSHNHGSEDGGGHSHSHGRTKKQQKGDAHGDSHGHGHDHGHEHGHAPRRAPVPPAQDTWTVWRNAILSTLGVSCSSMMTLALLPFLKDPNNLKVGMSFAVGGLLGDVFLHILPHIMAHGEGDHSHSHDHEGGGHSHSLSDLVPGLLIIVGIVVFLVIDKFMRGVMGRTEHGHSHGGHGGHGHDDHREHDHREHDHREPDRGHDHGADTESDRHHDDCVVGATGRYSFRMTPQRRQARERVVVPASQSTTRETPAPVVVGAASTSERHGAGHAQEPAAPADASLHTGAILNLAADVLHNFTDGLAIGVSYLVGAGGVTTLAVLFHELPHEVGDVALLIAAGYSHWAAIRTQFMTAMGAMLGTIVGLLSGQLHSQAANWIHLFTAGGFIYVATVAVMPKLLENTSPGQTLKEVIAIAAGVAIMAAVAYFE